MIRTILALAIGLGSLAGAIAQIPKPAPVDDDEVAERLELGRRALDQNCLICHSAELIVHQRLKPAQWQAEVTKMVGWGSPLPKEEESLLLDYLNAHYGPTVPAAAPERIRPDAIAAVLGGTPSVVEKAQDPAQGRALFAQHCATCHGPIARGGDLGNNLVLNPMLLDHRSFADVVHDGRKRMPGFAAALSEDQALQILAWLRGLDER